MSRRPRVVIADDHPLVLTALTRFLEPHVDVVGAAIDGEDLLRQVAALLPDAVVTDMSMPRMDGLEACRLIRRTYPAIHVVIVSGFLDTDLGASASELGANAVIRKIDMVRELPAAVLALFTASAEDAPHCRELPDQSVTRDTRPRP
jgi:DNA-binding NarL/FixJ family response regulator